MDGRLKDVMIDELPELHEHGVVLGRRDIGAADGGDRHEPGRRQLGSGRRHPDGVEP